MDLPSVEDILAGDVQLPADRGEVSFSAETLHKEQEVAATMAAVAESEVLGSDEGEDDSENEDDEEEEEGQNGAAEELEMGERGGKHAGTRSPLKPQSTSTESPRKRRARLTQSPGRRSGGGAASHPSPQDAQILLQVKHVFIDMGLIRQANVSDAEKASVGNDPGKIADLLLSKTSLRLDGLGITHIDNLEAFGHVTSLSLRNNRIGRVENLHFVSGLQSLDLGDNNIARLDPDELPRSLTELDLTGNPLVLSEDAGQLEEGLREILPRLRVLRLHSLPSQPHPAEPPVPSEICTDSGPAPSLKTPAEQTLHLVPSSPIRSLSPAAADCPHRDTAVADDDDGGGGGGDDVDDEDDEDGSDDDRVGSDRKQEGTTVLSGEESGAEATDTVDADEGDRGEGEPKTGDDAAARRRARYLSGARNAGHARADDGTPGDGEDPKSAAALMEDALRTMQDEESRIVQSMRDHVQGVKSRMRRNWRGENSNGGSSSAAQSEEECKHGTTGSNANDPPPVPYSERLVQARQYLADRRSALQDEQAADEAMAKRIRERAMGRLALQAKVNRRARDQLSEELELTQAEAPPSRSSRGTQQRDLGVAGSGPAGADEDLDNDDDDSSAEADSSP